MTTSYFKNIHLPNLLDIQGYIQGYIQNRLDIQVSLSSYISIKTGFFQTFYCIIIPISGIIDHYCIVEN